LSLIIVIGPLRRSGYFTPLDKNFSVNISTEYLKFETLLAKVLLCDGYMLSTDHEIQPDLGDKEV